tara:strand:+ start:258 stop:1961 length:1704 start_codon:yes stop_codon:yes gene_type:complete
MCGIIVMKADKFSQKQRSLFLNSLKSLNPRGPDETRVVEKKNYLLGFTRLSINNLKNGSQPFVSSCNRYVVLFNGEVLNYKNLINQFENKIEFKSKNEVELIINLYKLFGKKFVNHLRGFFSIVIIDLKFNEVFAAVDRFSIKPLYYVEKKDFFLFISDYSSLIKNGLVENTLNLDKISDYFTLAREFNDETIFKNIKKLEAATILTLNKKNKKIFYKYWQPFEMQNDPIISEESLIEEFDNQFLETTKLWQTAETKMSLSLSTGMDSNIIKMYLDKNRSKYTSFHLNEINEFSFKSGNVKYLNKDLSLIKKLINKFTKSSLTPFAVSHSSSTSLFQLYNNIAQSGFKFTFNGEGADELFGGYSRYQKLLFLTKKNKMSLSKAFVNLYRKEIEYYNACLKKKQNNLFNKIEKKINRVNLLSKKIENKLLEFDQLTWIPSLIQRHDIIGMLYGVEVRPPFLDHRLVNKVNSLSLKLKYNFNNNKILLMKLFKKNNKNITYMSYKKLPTPTIYDLLINDKKEMKDFAEKFFYGKLSKIFLKDKILKDLNLSKLNKIFFWRLYILNKMID